MKKLLNSFYGKMIGLLLSFFLFSNASQAQCRLLNENFDVPPVLSSTNVDGTWYPDRYRPAGFVNAVLGGNNVLKISIDGVNDGLLNRPAAYQYTFYNTQGRKFNQCGGCVTISKSDLWIPADWATNHRRTDMWATAYNNTNSVSTYPIIGFRNTTGSNPGIYYWDENVGWINSGVTVVYDSWYRLEFRLVGPNIEYYVNGVNVGTIASNSSTYLGDIIMQAYNFNDPTLPAINQSIDSYDAYWDNLKTTGPGGNFVTDVTTGQTFCTIQGAIDAANPGDYIQVHAGNYFEKATNRFVFGTNGPHKFGLFIDKANLTIEGLDASDNPVTNVANAAVVITTNATNNFGSSGIFVQASGVTLKGLKIGDNYNDANVRDNNKTIEVVGDAFNMNHCWVSTALDEGAFYMGRWDASHPITSYTLTQNKFENTLVSINNGVGLLEPRSGRVITNNTFTGVATPYLIGFRGWNGPDPVQGWIVDPVGGAVVTGNAFNTTGVDKYVVARGNAGGYINSELHWAEIWNLNTYGNHVVTLTDYPSFNVRTYTDATGYTETRRISPAIQENIGISQTGDVVNVGLGTYNESVNINKSITLRGAQAGNCAATRAGSESIINCVNGIGVNASNVTINGFTIQGQTSAAAPGFGFAVYMAPPNTGTQLLNNIIRNNVVGSSISNSGVSPSQVKIQCNWFDANNQPGAASGAGIYTDEYVAGGVVSNVLIDNNKFSGNDDAGIDFSESTAANAATGISISKNLFDGNNRAAFLFNVVSSDFTANTIINSTGAGTGDVRIYGGVNNFNIKNNFFNAGAPFGVRITDGGGINSSNISINENSFTGYSNSNYAIQNVSGYTGSVAATCNWYGTTDLSVIAPKISGSVTYIPYLINGTDNSSATGFQPVPNSCIGGIIVADIFHTTETCTDFKNGGNGKQLSQLCYITKANKVSNITPGQFFYYTAVTAPSASFCIDIVQTTSCSPNFKLFTIQQNNQVTLWDANCVKVATGTQPTLGQGRICITNATPGAVYVLSVKYDSKTVIGSSSVGTPTCTYTFESKIGSTTVPNSNTSINMVPNCSSSLAPAINNEITDLLESPVVKEEFEVKVSPNPSSSDFKIQVNSQSSEPILIRIMDAVGGVRSNTFKVAKGSVITVGNELRNGIYFAEVIQGKNRQVIKLIKQN